MHAPAPTHAPSPAPSVVVPSSERALWVEMCTREMPRYAIFFYNLLLDSKLPDHYKEHAFGTLNYLLSGGDIIPREDRNLNGLDELAFSLRCMSELVGRLPQAALAVYEDVLAREGISLRNRVREAPQFLDKFFFALGPLYKERISRFAPAFKSCVQTGMLVKSLQQFLAGYKVGPWPPERRRAVEIFLDSFAI